MSTENSVTARLAALLESGHATVTAVYRRDVPFAVVFGFGQPPMPVVEWAISRDLLADALVHGRAGVGDVRVTARGDLVVLALASPDGTGTAIFRRDDVAALLNLTHQLVQPGHEAEGLDWSDTTGFPGVAL